MSQRRALDLFCGAAAGWSLGLARAGVEIVAACEIDQWRRDVYAASHPGVLIYGDVRELTADRLLADLGYLPDIIVGSPPCQEISAANSKGTGITDDHLFWEWVRLVFEVRPVWCAAENSPRARTQGIDGVLDALAQGGYAAWPLVVGARDVGANHLRGRVWILAADGAAPADTVRHELRQQQQRLSRRRPSRVSDEGKAIAGGHAGHAAGEPGLRLGRVLGRSGTESAEARLQDAADTARAGRQKRSRRRRDHGSQLPPALRDIGLAWPDWNGGLAGLAASCAAAGAGGMDDGLPAGLSPNLRNRAIAAYGDAVVPQITEAIAKVMVRATAQTANYDPDDDMSKSTAECYRVIRERVAAGGPGWVPKQEE